MAVREHEAVAVHQLGLPGLNLSTCRHSTSAMSAIPWSARMPELAFGRIHRQGTNSVARSRRVGMTTSLFNKCDGGQAAYCPRCAPCQQPSGLSCRTFGILL